MSNRSQTGGENALLDVKVAEASKLHKFYLKQESKIIAISSAIVFLLVWELVGGVWELVNPLFISAPSLIWKAGLKYVASGEIWTDLKVSGLELLWGYLLSVVVGIPLGILTGWYKRAAYICDPYINALYATPRVAFLPLIIIWLGIGLVSKIGIIFLGAVFPIIIVTREGVKTTPYNLLNAANSFRASQWKIFKSLVFPWSVPFVLTGLKLGVARALIGVFIGELFAASAGVGYMITLAGATFRTDKVFVGIILFALTGWISMELLSKLERHFSKWRPKVGAIA